MINQVLSSEDKILLDQRVSGTWSLNSKTGLIDVNGHIFLMNLKLISIPFKFWKVSGDFYCEGNQLTSLEGSPQIVGSFYCFDNQLTSLVGCPEIVEYFYCKGNKIKSFEYMPECNNQSEVIRDIRRQIRQYLIDLGFDPKDKENFKKLMRAQERS